MVDVEVIKLCIEGKEKGHRILYESCAPYVYAIIRSYIYDESFHLDVLQETFAGVFSKIETYNSELGQFKPWLRKVTVNNCLLHLRNHKKLTTIDSIEGKSLEDLPSVNNINENISREEIEQLLRNMPTGYRTVFLMIAIDGWTHEEVSTALNISNTASRSQYLRAKNYIQHKILNQTDSSKYGIDN